MAKFDSQLQLRSSFKKRVLSHGSFNYWVMAYLKIKFYFRVPFSCFLEGSLSYASRHSPPLVAFDNTIDVLLRFVMIDPSKRVIRDIFILAK